MAGIEPILDDTPPEPNAPLSSWHILALVPKGTTDGASDLHQSCERLELPAQPTTPRRRAHYDGGLVKLRYFAPRLAAFQSPQAQVVYYKTGPIM